MKVIAIEVPELGNRAHLVHDGSVGLVVDPPRDLARVERAAEQAQVEIVAVADTHLHNDYLSGAPALARRHGADYLLHADEDVDFARVGVRDGDVVAVGTLSVTALWTPGHTPLHTSFVAQEDGGVPAVLSGGSLLLGTVGRTDLVDPALTEELARAQWGSVRRIAELVPAAAGLHPTHGFGSFCAGAAVDADPDVATVGSQWSRNPALTSPGDTFVPDLLAGFGPVPRYYAHMAELNAVAAGAAPVRQPTRVTEAELAAAVAGGAWVVDLRTRRAYAEAHLAGTVNVEYGRQCATYVGWLAPWGGDVVLLLDDPEDLVAVTRDLAGIGVDGLRAHVLAPDAVLPRPAGYRRTDWAGFAEAGPGPVVVDVRQRDEYDAGHLPGAIHIPVQDVEVRLADVPAGEVWVHCRSGYRAGIAASLLHRAGRDVVHVDDDWERVLDLGLQLRAA